MTVTRVLYKWLNEPLLLLASSARFPIGRLQKFGLLHRKCTTFRLTLGSNEEVLIHSRSRDIKKNNRAFLVWDVSDSVEEFHSVSVFRLDWMNHDALGSAYSFDSAKPHGRAKKKQTKWSPPLRACGPCRWRAGTCRRAARGAWRPAAAAGRNRPAVPARQSANNRESPPGRCSTWWCRTGTPAETNCKNVTKPANMTRTVCSCVSLSRHGVVHVRSIFSLATRQYFSEGLCGWCTRGLLNIFGKRTSLPSTLELKSGKWI